MKTQISFKKIMQATWLLLYLAFLLAMIVGNLVSGIFTLLPTSLLGWGSTKTSLLGYVTHCSFAPWSTLISLLLVSLGTVLLVRLIKKLRTNNITFTNIVVYYLVATGVVLAVTMFFPFTIALVGVYFIIKIIKTQNVKAEPSLRDEKDVSS